MKRFCGDPSLNTAARTLLLGLTATLFTGACTQTTSLQAAHPVVQATASPADYFGAPVSAGTALSPPAPQQYWSEAAITASLQHSGLNPAQVSLYIAPLQNPATHSSAPLADHQSEVALSPASTMKLITSAIALDVLGPGWQGETRLLVTEAANQQGVLTTPLYLQGRADVDLDGPALFQLLAQLRSLGVAQLAGGVVLDRSHWQDLTGTTADPWLQPFDESPRRRYNHNPDALALSQQMLTLQLDSRGPQAVLQSMPQISGLQINSQLTLTSAPCASLNTDSWQIDEQLQYQQGQPQLHLTIAGRAPKGCQWPLHRAWVSRQQLLPLLFRHYWQLLGGRFSDSGGDHFQPGNTPEHAFVLASHQSRPLSQVVQQLNKISDNSLARTLLLELGVVARQRQLGSSNDCGAAAQPRDTLADGRTLVCQWLKARNIDVSTLVLDSGAGLSRQERLSGQTLAGLIRYAATMPWFPDWLASLPRAGVDGTLQNRLADVADSARLKTGTLNNSTALAGVVWDRRQRPYIFVGIVNGEASPMLVVAGRQWLDQQVRLLATLN